MENIKFAMDRPKLVGALSAVLPSASKDETRPHMAAVLVETLPDDGIVRFVSTDGHRLTKLDVQAFPEWEVQAAELLLPRDKVEALVKALRARQKGHPELITVSAEGRSVTFKNEVSGDSTGFTSADENFPPYDKVIPDYSNGYNDRGEAIGGKIPIGFNAKYMADVAKVAAFCANGTSGGVKASFGGNRDPIRIDMANAEVGASAVVVIMPMRF